VKTRPGATSVADLRQAVAAGDPDVPIFDALSLEERFARFTATERLSASLAGLLGGIGVFLAAVGVYAVLAYSVRRRLPELGIRAALGARPADVRRTVFREAALLIVAGGALGGTLCLFALPSLDAELFTLAVSRSAAVAIAGLGVVLAAAASTIVPAVRASRIDPVRALAEH
jgi:ABC-type antimicrobial peptide transport system permease subunit